MARTALLAIRLALAATILAVPLTTVNAARAQVFGPPSTVFGSVTDAAGPVAENVPVEAYIGDKVCGRGKTQYTGEGASRVTVYYTDVVSREQTPGCGFPNAEVRIKVGDRFAAQTAKWNAGPVPLNVTFGNATPAPIPTFTPAPTRTPTPTREATAPAGAGTAGTPVPGGTGGTGGTGPGAVATIPAGQPGAGSPVATVKGGVSSSSPIASVAKTDDGGGFPVWAVVVLVLGGLAIVGGGAGFGLSRRRRAHDGDGDAGDAGESPWARGEEA